MNDQIGSGAQVDKVGCIRNTIAIGNSRFFDYNDPTIDQIFIEDIAKALSNLCRFNGHCNYYSVAEHSVYCAELAKQYGYPQYVQFHALMHDAAEAYIGDMPKPLKIMIPDFQAIEARIASIIEKAFNIDTSQPDLIKRFDLEMLKKEKEFLFPSHKEINWFGFDTINDIDIELVGYPPRQAEKLFMLTFHEIALQENRNVRQRK